MNLFNKGYILWISSKLTEIILKICWHPPGSFPQNDWHRITSRTVPDWTFCRKTMPKAYQKLNTLGVKIRFMRWNTRNPRSGAICLHPWKFSSASTQCAFHGMSFLVSLRIYVWRLFYRPRRKPWNCLHALFLSQRFYRCRRLRNYFTCQTRCDNFHDLWRQY